MEVGEQDTRMAFDTHGRLRRFGKDRSRVCMKLYADIINV